MTGASPVYCAISAGTTLVARKPNKFFISFKSKVTDGSKFFLNSFYSPVLTSDSYHNSQMCSDGGANVISIPDNVPNTEGSTTGETITGGTTVTDEKEVCLTNCCLEGTGCTNTVEPEPTKPTTTDDAAGIPHDAPVVQLSAFADR